MNKRSGQEFVQWLTKEWWRGMTYSLSVRYDVKLATWTLKHSRYGCPGRKCIMVSLKQHYVATDIMCWKVNDVLWCRPANLEEPCPPVNLNMYPLTVYNHMNAVIMCCDWDPDPPCILESNVRRISAWFPHSKGSVNEAIVSGLLASTFIKTPVRFYFSYGAPSTSHPWWGEPARRH